jgi:hypothetical protein
MPAAHRPEVPSVTGTFANERLPACEPKPTDRVPAPFSPRLVRARDTRAHSPWLGKIGWDGEQAHRPSTRRSAPE